MTFLRKLAWAACCGSACLTWASALGQDKIRDTMAERTAACVACHGADGRATAEGFFPRIAGKPSGYLYNQLVNFRDGRRRNAQMVYMVGYMPDQYLKEIADYFAGLHPPYPPPQASEVSQAALSRGRQLALAGDPSRGIAACVACHGAQLTGVQPAIPGLLGLSRYYLVAQFGAWQSGVRQAAAPDCMAHLARRMTPEDIGAVSSWLAAQPVPSEMRAAPAGSVKLPIACGSVPASSKP
jgi:cytochrome c553